MYDQNLTTVGDSGGNFRDDVLKNVQAISRTRCVRPPYRGEIGVPTSSASRSATKHQLPGVTRKALRCDPPRSAIDTLLLAPAGWAEERRSLLSGLARRLAQRQDAPRAKHGMAVCDCTQYILWEPGGIGVWPAAKSRLRNRLSDLTHEAVGYRSGNPGRQRTSRGRQLLF